MCRGRGPACTSGWRRSTSSRNITEKREVRIDFLLVTCPDLRHVVETHQDGGGEQEAGGGDEEKHVAEIEKSLVLGGSPVPRSQGHHTGASDHRHVGGLSLLFVNTVTLKVVKFTFPQP